MYTPSEYGFHQQDAYEKALGRKITTECAPAADYENDGSQVLATTK